MGEDLEERVKTGLTEEQKARILNEVERERRRLILADAYRRLWAVKVPFRSYMVPKNIRLLTKRLGDITKIDPALYITIQEQMLKGDEDKRTMPQFYRWLDSEETARNLANAVRPLVWIDPLKFFDLWLKEGKHILDSLEMDPELGGELEYRFPGLSYYSKIDPVSEEVFKGVKAFYWEVRHTFELLGISREELDSIYDFFTIGRWEATERREQQMLRGAEPPICGGWAERAECYHQRSREIQGPYAKKRWEEYIRQLIVQINLKPLMEAYESERESEDEIEGAFLRRCKGTPVDLSSQSLTLHHHIDIFSTIDYVYHFFQEGIDANWVIGDYVKEFINLHLRLGFVRDEEGNFIDVNEVIDQLKRIVGIKNLDYEKLRESLKINECGDFEEFMECVQVDVPNYRVVKRLGSGVAGTIYKVYSPALQHHRAVKVIDPDKVNPAEAQLMVKIEGKDLENIVQIYEAGDKIVTVEGVQKCAIVMEYVDGRTLREIIAEGPLIKEEVLEYGSQLLRAIMSLRNYGITHRDLNPKNIKVNSKGVVKILDFGIATDEPEPEQRDARRYGTPSEMIATDLFSFGLLVYEMGTGKHLVAERTGSMGSTTHAERIAQLKEELYDEEGNLKEQYRKKIEVLPGYISNTVSLSLRYAVSRDEEILSRLQRYITSEQLQDYKMRYSKKILLEGIEWGKESHQVGDSKETQDGILIVEGEKGTEVYLRKRRRSLLGIEPVLEKCRGVLNDAEYTVLVDAVCGEKDKT